jgi:hypothetical protein
VRIVARSEQRSAIRLYRKVAMAASIPGQTIHHEIADEHVKRIRCSSLLTTSIQTFEMGGDHLALCERSGEINY